MTGALAEARLDPTSVRGHFRQSIGHVADGGSTLHSRRTDDTEFLSNYRFAVAVSPVT
jgi:hypothetical protein